MCMAGKGQANNRHQTCRLFEKNRIAAAKIQTKTIDIYDKDGNYKLTSKSIKFKDFCLLNELPFTALKGSYQNGGTIIGTQHSMSRLSELTIKYSGWFAIERQTKLPIMFIKPKDISIKSHHQSKIVDIYNINGDYVESLEGIISNLIKDKYPSEILSSYKNHGEPILNNNYRLAQVDKKYHHLVGWFAIEREKNNKKYVREPFSNIQPKKVKDSFVSYKSSTIEIYNRNDQLVMTSKKSFNRFCDEHGLPHKALLNSMRTGNGCYTKQKCRKNQYKKYVGWYAKKIKGIV